MPARFDKVRDPAMGDFDGFDLKQRYQMVPVGEVRPMGVVVGDRDCVIRVVPAGAAAPAHMQRFTFAPGVPRPPQEFEAFVPARTRVTFDIFGRRRGNASIQLVAPDGTVVDDLAVSVKDRVSKTVALVRLADMRRSCPFPRDQLPLILERVSRTYRQQANVELRQLGDVFEANAPADLGDPLVPERREVSSAILAATPNGAMPADFIVYFTWDLRARAESIVGQNFGKLCFVEHNAGSDTENMLTTGHELGHGLGLKHCAAHTLMAGDGVSRSSLLQRFEIDMVNATDEIP